jgi:hypothetical protein
MVARWGSRLGAAGRSQRRQTASDVPDPLATSRPDLHALVFVLVSGSSDFVDTEEVTGGDALQQLGIVGPEVGIGAVEVDADALSQVRDESGQVRMSPHQGRGKLDVEA